VRLAVGIPLPVIAIEPPARTVGARAAAGIGSLVASPAVPPVVAPESRAIVTTPIITRVGTIVGTETRAVVATAVVTTIIAIIATESGTIITTESGTTVTTDVIATAVVATVVAVITPEVGAVIATAVVTTIVAIVAPEVGAIARPVGSLVGRTIDPEAVVTAAPARTTALRRSFGSGPAVLLGLGVGTLVLGLLARRLRGR
jgi:hypothetical protein